MKENENTSGMLANLANGAFRQGDSESRDFVLMQSAMQMRQKYIYFLLAAVGACIGFSMTQSTSSMLTPWIIPLAGALICWAWSFYFGCVSLNKFSDAVLSNSRVINPLIGTHPSIYLESGQVEESRNSALKNFQEEVNLAILSYKRQLKLFAWGVGFYVVWHFCEMWRRTPEHICLWT